MGILISLLVAIVVAVVIGLGATWYLRHVRLPREEAAEGVAALADMRWRDFLHLVLDVLAARGYIRANAAASTADEADIPLERDGETWILSSKHGASYVLDSDDISEFSRNIRMLGASGGLLATPGNFAAGARKLAALQQIELLDGPSLWPELRERMSPEQRAAIGTQARARARQHAGFAWLGGVVLGAAILLLAPTGGDLPTSAPGASATVAAPRAARATAAAPARPAPESNSISAPRDADPAVLEKQRKEAAHAIGSLAMVDHALWSTPSTLVVYLSNDKQDAKAAICPLLERYPDLAASRVQLQLPAERDAQVRFFQCQAY